MNTKKMLGTIKWYKPEKGYGYIIGGDEELYFFENINCVNSNDVFTSDEIVLFIPNIGQIDFATEVEKLESSVEDEIK